MLMLSINAMVVATLGCDSDHRVAEVATEAARRQAGQNEEMIRLNREVAENNRRLVEADSQARQEVLQVQRDLIERDAEGREQLDSLEREVQATVKQERSSLDHQHEKLDDERKEIATQRNRDPIVAAAITGLGVVLACLAPIVLAMYLLRTVHRQEPTDAELAELLVQEIASDRSVLFGPGGRDRPCLGHDAAALRLPPASEDDPRETEHSPA